RSEHSRRITFHGGNRLVELSLTVLSQTPREKEIGIEPSTLGRVGSKRTLGQRDCQSQFVSRCRHQQAQSTHLLGGARVCGRAKSLQQLTAGGQVVVYLPQE